MTNVDIASQSPPIWIENPDWWEANEYRTGELYLPGQSRLSADDRAVLEQLAKAADGGKIHIPPMPKAAMEAARILRLPDPEVEEIAKCIELDPAMAAWLLKHANSALFGARVPIDTVGHAVAHLGLRRLKSIILELAMKRMSDDVNSRFWAEREWKHAVACAAISKELARQLGMDVEMSYLAGLLHDIGRVPLLPELEKNQALPHLPGPDCPADIIMETLHRNVGLQVAQSWDLPPAIIDAIGSHLTGRLSDEESTARFPSTRVAEAASDLCIALGIGRERRPFAILECPSLLDLGFSPELLVKWFKTEFQDVLTTLQSVTG
ncbi:MAG: HDOD domain-containing protein [Planctomycetes bacterium]|nr:HDOD domain-containing protein [Planctomycetota bacterium]